MSRGTAALLFEVDAGDPPELGERHGVLDGVVGGRQLPEVGRQGHAVQVLQPAVVHGQRLQVRQLLAKDSGTGLGIDSVAVAHGVSLGEHRFESRRGKINLFLGQNTAAKEGWVR